MLKRLLRETFCYYFRFHCQVFLIISLVCTGFALADRGIFFPNIYTFE